MTYAARTYFVGDGTTKIFAVAFPYMLSSHVHVFINGAENTAFTWPTSSTIQMTVAPAADAQVLVQRITPDDAARAVIQTGTILPADINLDVTQGLYIDQEHDDSITSATGLVATATAAATAAQAAASTAVSTAAGYLVTPSVASFKALAFASIADGRRVAIEGHLAKGDGGDREGYWDAASVATGDDALTIALTASPSVGRFKILGPKDGILINHFGANVGNANNGPQIKAAILAARNAGVNKIYIPFQAKVTERLTQNCSGVGGEDYAVPNGLTFVGIGNMNSDAFFVSTEPGILNNGANHLWDQRNPNSLNFVGHWKFDNLKFKTVNAAYDMFRFGLTDISGALYAPADIAGNPCYTRHVAFERCYLLGQHGPGDGITGCKVFEFYMDPQTLIRECRRGIWLRGCDQPLMLGRFELNGRHVQIEGMTPFGNNATIRPRQLAAMDASSVSEAKYQIYDTGQSTIIDPGQIEDTTATATAQMYLGGKQTLILSPMFNSVTPAFELGAGFLDGNMIAPMCPLGGIAAPIIAAPADVNFGTLGADYRLYIHRAPRVFVDACGIHPRLRYVNAVEGTTPSRIIPGTGLITTTGSKRPHIYMDAFNYFGSKDGTGIALTAGLTGMSTDASFQGGWRMELDSGYGHAIKLICGVDFVNGDWIRWIIQGKFSAGHAATVDYHIRKNGGADITSGNLSNNTTLTNNAIDYQTSGFAAGDELQLIITSGASQRYYLGSHEVFISETRIVDLGVPAFVDAATTHALLLLTNAAFNAVHGLVRTRT